ncbi:MAG: ketose-bisphosphate aldolase [Bifidobacteriaceae bacterium]|jgi:fructose-bisphosphate aldolase class II|nr:ketose-bisphosphate aldolase [Bifidobacteriaceae bacterium]
MSLTTLTKVLRAAEQGGYAVGAFNVSDLNQAIAVLDAASALSSPVIVQVLARVGAYRDEGRWWDALRRMIEAYPEVTAVLHLDHGQTYSDCLRAVEHGFTSVMIDASRDVHGAPNDFSSNVHLTGQVCGYAHAHAVDVEGELGTVGGAEGAWRRNEADMVYANPDQAEEFARRTGVDALAVAVGTSHGAVKFTSPEAGQRLRLEVIRQIKSRLPDTFLVLHGSSSIPAHAIAAINRAGGQVEPSFGIDAEQKRLAIEGGIRKINQGTDSHLVWTAALRTYLSLHPSEVEPSGPVGAAMEAMTRIVGDRMAEFGSAGQARRPQDNYERSRPSGTATTCDNSSTTPDWSRK